VHPWHTKCNARRNKSQFLGHFLLCEEDWELELVVLDRLLEATTKKSSIFKEKSAPAHKILVDTCRRPCVRHWSRGDHVAQTVPKILSCYRTTCRRLQRSHTMSVADAVHAPPPATTRCRTSHIRSRRPRDLRGSREIVAA